MVAAINTPGDFAVALLQQLNAPVTQSNVQFLIAWADEEGGNWHNAASFNPLNTTEDAPGAVSMNSVGVKAYGSWDQGIAATVSTLKNGDYGDIIASLQGGDAATTAVNAAGLRTWSGGGYSTIMATIPQSAGAAQQAVASAGLAGGATGTLTTLGLSSSFSSAPTSAGGADAQDLIDLAVVLEQRAETVNTLTSGLTGQLSAAVWSGPAATAFGADQQQFVTVANSDSDLLRAAASDLRRLADDLQTQLNQLYAIETQVRTWFATNAASTVVVPPWPQSDLPPTGDPRWRQVQQAFVSAGLF
jgi:hypothetical protein